MTDVTIATDLDLPDETVERLKGEGVAIVGMSGVRSRPYSRAALAFSLLGLAPGSAPAGVIPIAGPVRGTAPNPERMTKAERKREKRRLRNLRLSE